MGAIAGTARVLNEQHHTRPCAQTRGQDGELGYEYIAHRSFALATHRSWTEPGPAGKEGRVDYL